MQGQYTKEGMLRIGEIIRKAYEESGEPSRNEFCKMICQESDCKSALNKDALRRLINAGRPGGSQGRDFWRLAYLAHRTNYSYKQLIAIAEGRDEVEVRALAQECSSRQSDVCRPSGKKKGLKRPMIIFSETEAQQLGYIVRTSIVLRSWNPDDLAKKLNIDVEQVHQVCSGFLVAASQDLLESLLPYLFFVDFTLEPPFVNSGKEYSSLEELIAGIRSSNNNVS